MMFIRKIFGPIIKTPFSTVLFGVYSSLYIFSMVNREFLLFGIDLRYLTFGLGVFLSILGMCLYAKNRKKTIKTKEKKSRDVIFICLVAFFLWSLVSNISWIWNGLEMEKSQWVRQNILLANNLLAVIVYRQYGHVFEKDHYKKIVVYSCLVLLLSFVLTGAGFSLSEISGSDVRSMSVSTDAISHTNLFGGGFRLAGYAEDANYASLFLIIGIFAVLQIKKWAIVVKIVLTVLFAIALGFSCSKTILIAIPVGLVYGVAVRLLKNRRAALKVINMIIPAALFVVAVVLPKANILSTMKTMETRYIFWDTAKQISKNSPVIGNGVGSTRSAINMKYEGGWYVQSHSNYWQIMAEMGAIGVIIFVALCYKCLNEEKITTLDKVVIIILLLFGVSCEIIQLQVFVYTIYICSLGRNSIKSKAKDE